MWFLGDFTCLSWLLFYLLPQCSCSLHPGFSKIQHGRRLYGSLINTFPEFSFLDCVTECLVTTRCVSVNYCPGANFCEMSYKVKSDTENLISSGWVYSEKEYWPKGLARACKDSNCNINETCKYKSYTHDQPFECVLSDCGIPNGTAMHIANTKRVDAIGVHRMMHASCSEGYFRFGSGRLVCQSNGEWHYDIHCEEGWFQYENHIYRLFKISRSWDSAKEHCKSVQAYLVEIESLQENTFINQTFYSKCICHYAWTGGRYRQNESDFIWSESGNKISSTHLSLIYPNYGDCLGYLFRDGTWMILSCALTLPFICERDIP